MQLQFVVCKCHPHAWPCSALLFIASTLLLNTSVILITTTATTMIYERSFPSSFPFPFIMHFPSLTLHNLQISSKASGQKRREFCTSGSTPKPTTCKSQSFSKFIDFSSMFMVLEHGTAHLYNWILFSLTVFFINRRSTKKREHILFTCLKIVRSLL